MRVLAAIHVNQGTFLAIVRASALAGTLATVSSRGRIVLPAVVLELRLGVVLRPEAARTSRDGVVAFFADLGLGMLFFFAGYEMDIDRIRGRPLRLGVIGWILRARRPARRRDGMRLCEERLRTPRPAAVTFEAAFPHSLSPPCSRRVTAGTRRRSLLATVPGPVGEHEAGQPRGRDGVLLERQELADARLIERPLYERRPRDQRELISAPLAEPAAKCDHRHSDRVDVGEPAEIERYPGDPFFAEPLYLCFERMRRTAVELTREDERMRPSDR
jgi:hypothetical protein